MRTLIVCTILVFCYLCFSCSSHLIKVPTGAMQPTIKIDAYVLTDENAYQNNQKIERFDIVIHKRPITDKDKRFGFNENTRFIFRIVGLGGEKVEIKKGQIFINDNYLTETFEKVSSDDNFGPIVIPESEFFLLGDNRPESEDSRFWKPATIKRENIVGKVVKIF